MSQKSLHKICPKSRPKQDIDCLHEHLIIDAVSTRQEALKFSHVSMERRKHLNCLCICSPTHIEAASERKIPLKLFVIHQRRKLFWRKQRRLKVDYLCTWRRMQHPRGSSPWRLPYQTPCQMATDEDHKDIYRSQSKHREAVLHKIDKQRCIQKMTEDQKRWPEGKSSENEQTSGSNKLHAEAHIADNCNQGCRDYLPQTSATVL